MTIQADQNRQGTWDQLTLLGMATLVLLFFAWTYFD
jgi:hypothetical protein